MKTNDELHALVEKYGFSLDMMELFAHFIDRLPPLPEPAPEPDFADEAMKLYFKLNLGTDFDGGKHHVIDAFVRIYQKGINAGRSPGPMNT